FKVAEVDIMYGEGISQEGELITMAVEKDIVDKSGAWYGYKGERIGQGKEKTKAYLREHPEVFEDIKARVRAAYGIGDVVEEEITEGKPEAKKKETTKKADDPEEITLDVDAEK
ncbi:MAG: DNA recombination/repair protein RecA, partial [Lactobacillales bacterium]|nr:DNA recombination/repair protein RecA [Lactobacillales bacterium]